jgi:hypothetical protein
VAAFRKSLAIRETLATRDPANTQRQRDLSYSATKVADCYEQNRNHAEALRFAERSLVIDERLSALDPTNAVWQRDVSVSRAQVARLREAQSTIEPQP